MTFPFSSNGNNNVVIPGSTTSASGTLPGTEGNSIRVYNEGTTIAFIRFGIGSAPTAVATDTFIAGGATEVFGLPKGVTHVAVIYGTGTGNVYFQRGDGA